MNGNTTTNGRAIKTYDAYKGLTKEQKELWVFEQLCMIPQLHKKFDGLSKRYAGIWVQRLVYGFVTIILLAVVGAMVNNVMAK